MKAACCTIHKHDIYQSHHPVCTVVQGSKVSCAQLNITHDIYMSICLWHERNVSQIWQVNTLWQSQS